jgi:chromosome segregation ATPase
MGSGAQTEAEKERMAVGGLVTEVEVLSLTNAQLVLDLHRLRKERYEFEELATATQEKNRMMQQQLDELLPSKSALEQQCQMLADKAKGLETELNQRKHLKTPSGKWVAFSMLVSRRDLDAELQERRAEFEEWMHSRREALERELRGKEQYLLDRIDDKEREIADLRQELRDQVQLKEKGLTELAEMQSKRRLHEEKCQSEVSAAKTEVDLAKRTIKDLEAQVCARLRVGLFCHNVGLFCPIM